jgi:hypothetical protein
MKRMFLSLLAFMAAAVTLHADNVSVEDVELPTGVPQAFDVCLDNTNEYIALQMNLTLPEGVDIDKEGCSLSDRMASGMTLSIGKKNDHYVVIVTSDNAAPFTGESGPILFLSLLTDIPFTTGEATLSDIRFVTTAGERVFMDDCTFNITRIIPDDEGAEPYVILTPNEEDDGYYTLTFVYDNKRDKRTETTYGLEEVDGEPEWFGNGVCFSVNHVVFDESFAQARPTMTHSWIREMPITEVEGLEYLNTSEVTNTDAMFFYSSIEHLDLSNMDISNVYDSEYMLYGCSALKSLSLSSSMENLGESACEGVGYPEHPCVLTVPEGFDFGVETKGRFQWKGGWWVLKLLGDVNLDGDVTVTDVTTMVDYVLGNSPDPFGYENADTSMDGQLSVTDVTCIVDTVLSTSY